MEPETRFPSNEPGVLDDIHDRIAMRAYELYLARGGVAGGDFDDWLAAEREIAGSNRRRASKDRSE
jgi:hypothetical protein